MTPPSATDLKTLLLDLVLREGFTPDCLYAAFDRFEVLVLPLKSKLKPKKQVDLVITAMTWRGDIPGEPDTITVMTDTHIITLAYTMGYISHTLTTVQQIINNLA
jgi:hypothetical protein